MRYALLIFILITTICQAQKFDLDSLNRMRVRAGVPPLRKSIILEIHAKNWLCILEHTNSGMVHDTETDEGEVITNSVTPLLWWTDSPAHRRVLMSRRFKKIGIAEYHGVWCARLD